MARPHGPDGLCPWCAVCGDGSDRTPPRRGVFRKTRNWGNLKCVSTMLYSRETGNSKKNYPRTIVFGIVRSLLHLFLVFVGPATSVNYNCMGQKNYTGSAEKHLKNMVLCVTDVCHDRTRIIYLMLLQSIEF